MGFPFAFDTYFSTRSAKLEKYVKVLEASGLRGQNGGDYTTLAVVDPVRLWRELSVGIWLEANGKK